LAASATCGEDFKPYSPILANLTGVCYRWGSVPTCGFTALSSAQTIHDRYHLRISANSLAIGIVAIFTIVNLLGVKYTARIAMPMAVISAGLAFISSLAPVLK
jgi:amino acid transporter